jgi:EpsI family protein
MLLNGYIAVENSFSEAVYSELNADKHIYRHYFPQEGAKEGKIDLYIGYYGTAKSGRTPHNPFACLPSQGWTILNSGTVSIKTKLFPEGVQVNYMLSKQDNTYRYILNWYQSSGTRILDSGIKRNVHRFFGMILHNRNDGAYVQLSQAGSYAELKQIRESVTSFTGTILDILPQYWPSER